MNSILKTVETLKEKKDYPHFETIAHMLLSSQMTDFARLCINIKNTSLGYEDKEDRIFELSKASGVDTYTVRTIVNQ